MHPLWDATVLQIPEQVRRQISIHASLMGCNDLCIFKPTTSSDFNSCIPYGMQLAYMLPSDAITIFQFMHPLWDATEDFKEGLIVPGFQFMHPLWDATHN